TGYTTRVRRQPVERSNIHCRSARTTTIMAYSCRSNTTKQARYSTRSVRRRNSEFPAPAIRVVAPAPHKATSSFLLLPSLTLPPTAAVCPSGTTHFSACVLHQQQTQAY